MVDLPHFFRYSLLLLLISAIQSDIKLLLTMGTYLLMVSRQRCSELSSFQLHHQPHLAAAPTGATPCIDYRYRSNPQQTPAIM